MFVINGMSLEKDVRNLDLCRKQQAWFTEVKKFGEKNLL